MSSIIKGLAAKEAITPVKPSGKSSYADLLNRHNPKPVPDGMKKQQEKPEDKKKEEQGLHLIAEADNNLLAKQKARFYLDTYIKEHNAVYQKLVDAIYQLAKQTGVNHNDLRDAAPDIRYAKQQLIKATQNFIDLYDEALDLKMNEGQIYSTGGGAGEGWRWYKPQAAGLEEGIFGRDTPSGFKLEPGYRASDIGMDVMGTSPKTYIIGKYYYDINSSGFALTGSDVNRNNSQEVQAYREKLAKKYGLVKDEKGWYLPIKSNMTRHHMQSLLRRLEYYFDRPISKVRVAKKQNDTEQLDEKCWDTHKQVGMKKKGGKMVPNCVPKESVENVSEISDFKKKELEYELRNEPKNNYQVSIDGRAWKVFADKAHAEAVARTLRAKGNKAEVHLTGASPSVNENVNTLVNDAYKASFNAIQKVWTKLGKEPKNDQEFLDLAEQWGYVLFSKDASPAQAQEAAERLAAALIPYWHDYHWKKKPMGEATMTNENLRKWFKEKWVRFGPDGKIRGDCARGDDSEGKPKCLPQSKAHSLGKKGRASAASRKRREDPNPERSGKAINVATKKKSNEGITEGAMNAAQALRDFNAMAKVKDKLTYNGIKEAGHADKILNAISACSAFVNHFKNNKDLNSAKIFDTLRSELIAFKNGDITTLYHLIKRGTLDKINLKEENVEEAKLQKCPECGGEMVSEELMNEKKDACYHKVKARYKVWPSAYASGALVKCRKKGASNWGKSKAKESMELTSEEKRKTNADHVVNEYSRAASAASANKSHAGRKKNDDAKAKEHKAKSESSIIKGMVEANIK